jgi:glycine/D-amino acid oxidase-like deaminating enzyme
VRATLGPESAQALWSLTERAVATMTELARGAIRPVGSLRLAVDTRERGRLAAEFAALREDGFEAEWIDELASPLGRRFAGAIVHPGDGAIDPVRWVRTLARLAVDSGAQIVEGSRVDVDSLDAATVVVATDGLTAELLPELAHIVRPVRGQMLATEPLGRRLFDRPHYARDGYDYWQQLPNGILVIGGGRDASLAAERTSVEETTSIVQERLEALVVDLLGELPRVTHRWAGIWGETPDDLPLAGRLPGRERVWVIGGYSGHGNVLGFACGELVARAIVGETPAELGFFDPARFGPLSAESA